MLTRAFGYLQYIWNTYPKLHVLIELILIGFVVFSVLRFLRGTGGEKVLKGVFLLRLGVWVVSQITSWAGLDLERIGWLFRLKRHRHHYQ